MAKNQGGNGKWNGQVDSNDKKKERKLCWEEIMMGSILEQIGQAQLTKGKEIMLRGEVGVFYRSNSKVAKKDEKPAILLGARSKQIVFSISAPENSAHHSPLLWSQPCDFLVRNWGNVTTQDDRMWNRQKRRNELAGEALKLMRESGHARSLKPKWKVMLKKCMITGIWEPNSFAPEVAGDGLQIRAIGNDKGLNQQD